MKTKKKVIISMLAVSTTLALGAFMGGCSLSDKIEQWRCDHENITENVVIDPTCYEKGEMKETCDDCGKTWTEDIAKVAHTWNDGEVVVEATCTETGITRYTCTVEGCEAVEDRITDKLEHTRVEMPAVAPTCDTVGYTEWYKCGDCGLVLTKKQELPALGHVETALKAVAPTCTETGLTAGVGCVTCGEVITAQTVIPATGHNIVTVAGKAPTCTETGLTDGQKCEDCGKIFVERVEIPLLGYHVFEDGLCTYCGLVETLTANATEKAVTKGEVVAGNWYRIYRPTDNANFGTLSLDNDTSAFFQTCALTYSNNAHYNNYIFFSGPLYTLKGMNAVICDEYIDVFLREGSYACAYLIYTVQSSLIIANYSVRVDTLLYDLDNFPLWNADFFKRDSRLLDSFSRHCKILDFDMLRLGQIMLENNPNRNAYGFGVYGITELDKERKNTPELKDVKATDDECNQKNDLFNVLLKMSRHACVIANRVFVKVFADLQRPDSLGADCRELGEVTYIEEKTSIEPVLPFFSLYYLFEMLIDWAFKPFRSIYAEYRFNRSDNTLPLYLFKGVESRLQHIKERTRNVFGSATLTLELQSGRMDGNPKKRKWYRMPKKIYSRRYTTDCQQAIFERRAEHNFVGIDDLREYAEDMANGEELIYQNSHMQVELLRCVA